MWQSLSAFQLACHLVPESRSWVPSHTLIMEVAQRFPPRGVAERPLAYEALGRGPPGPQRVEEDTSLVMLRLIAMTFAFVAPPYQLDSMVAWSWTGHE